MYSNELVDVVEKENIHLIHKDMDQNILGSYTSYNNLKIIIINNSITNNKNLSNTILAEELGHYFTSKGDNAPYQSNIYLDSINHIKTENLALKWATNFLIPIEKLLNIISSDNYINLTEISGHFEVTKDFLMKRFYYMSLKKNQYRLSKNRYLILSNYPSIFIYRKD